MLSTANVSIQFGAKPLFEQVSVKFADGNRYGLIGANGSGKSTFMKILGGELEQSSGEVMLQTGLRLGKLNQNQFAYEDERVLDVVMQGHTEMWHAMKERDLIYADGPLREVIAGIWLLLYGVGIAACGLFSLGIVLIAGFAFMGLGTVALAAPAAWAPALLGVGFGGIHLVLGALIMRDHGG